MQLTDGFGHLWSARFEDLIPVDIVNYCQSLVESGIALSQAIEATQLRDKL